MGLFRKKKAKDSGAGGSEDPRALAMAEVLEAERLKLTVTGGPSNIVANTPLRWRVRLRLEPEGAAPFEATGTMNVAQGSSLYEGLRIAVRYDAADPTFFEIDKVDGVAMMVEDHAGPINVAGMDMKTLIRSATSDPKGFNAQMKDWQQSQHAAAEAQTAAIMGQVEQLQQAAMQQAGQQAGGTDLAAQLAQLDQMHQSGALSAEEFAAAKARLLGS